MVDDGWWLLDNQWWISLALMVDNCMTYAGWTGREGRKAYHSILGVNWTRRMLQLRRVDSNCWSSFVLTRLYSYMDIMLR